MFLLKTTGNTKVIIIYLNMYCVCVCAQHGFPSERISFRRWDSVLRNYSPGNQRLYNAMHKTCFPPIYCHNQMTLSKLFNIHNTLFRAIEVTNELNGRAEKNKQKARKTTITMRKPIYQEKAPGITRTVYPKEFSELQLHDPSLLFTECIPCRLQVSHGSYLLFPFIFMNRQGDS